MNIKISTFLQKLLLPLGVAIIFFILTTFLAYYSGNGELRILQINWHRILQLFDLREENTLGTWFSSILFLTVSLAFMLLGWSHSAMFRVSQTARRWFQLTALGTCLLSADEVASIHETSGKWIARVLYKEINFPADDKGFSWMFLLGPIALISLLMVTYHLYQVSASLPAEKRVYIKNMLLISIGSLISVFGFEALEAYFSYIQPTQTIFPCFEEAAEIVGMYSLLFCTVSIITHYEL